MGWLLFPVELQAALFRTGADGTPIGTGAEQGSLEFDREQQPPHY